MASNQYGHKRNPYWQPRDPLGVKCIRQPVMIMNNPSTIYQNQHLVVRFPNLVDHDVVMPGTARLTFTIQLVSTNVSTDIVQTHNTDIEQTLFRILAGP